MPVRMFLFFPLNLGFACAASRWVTYSYSTMFIARCCITQPTAGPERVPIGLSVTMHIDRAHVEEGNNRRLKSSSKGLNKTII